MKFTIVIIFLLFLIPFTAISFSQQVPDWVKNTAGWWSTDAISEQEFVNAIEFLIKDEIIQVDVFQSSTNSQSIPDWVKNTAGWWSIDAISEQEFVNAIEFLIKSGIIHIPNSSCSPNEDKNSNNIPDVIEDIPNLVGMSTNEVSSITNKFHDRDWSNCIIPKKLSHYTFKNINFTNVDLSNSELKNTQFSTSLFNNTNFSNSMLHGVSFFKSEFYDVNFTNADFSMDSWENPFVIFTYKSNDRTFYCSFNPCAYHSINVLVETSELLTATFGPNTFPTNLRYVETIIDESDNRTTWRNIPNFAFSKIHDTNFNNSDFSYGMIISSELQNINFNKTDMSDVMIYQSSLENVELRNEVLNIIIDKPIIVDQKKYKSVESINIEKYGTYDDVELGVEFLTAIDDTVINWAMGMLIHEDKLYIADTDNHRTLVYDKNTLNELYSIISPKQNFCDGVNAFTSETFSDISETCSDDLRNIPTSLAIIKDKIFIAYGMQNEIQIFDKDGNYMTSFGIKGNNDGEFNFPYKIFASSNKLYIADTENQRIQTFDSNGNFLQAFSTNVNLKNNSFPSDLVVYNNQIFVFDSNNSSVLIFDKDGTFLRSFSINTADFSKEELVGIDISEELLFISASENDKVIIVDMDGNDILSFGTSGIKYGEFDFPLDVVVDGNKLYVSDAKNFRIQVFSIVR